MALEYNEKLKKVLSDRRITQHEFATTIGRDPSFVSQVIRGRINPTESEKIIMANALNVNTSEIFKP